MKILLLEYITAGGLSGMSLPASLLCEGMLMRDALFSDFSAIVDVEIATTYDARLTPPVGNIKQVIRIDNSANAHETWQAILQTCDAALVVAPETDGVLSSLTQMVEAVGVKNLGCLQRAVDIASNKYDTFQMLKNAGILTIATYTTREFLHPDFHENKSFNSGYVAKPNDGAGCEDTVYFNEVAALQTWLHHNQDVSLDLDKYQDRYQDRYIVQPYQKGTPASISMLCKHGKAWVLSCNQQAIEVKASETKGSEIQTAQPGLALIQYKGCQVNGLSMHYDAFTKLADSIAAAMPDLHGYIGVDVIINDNDIYVVEINPRISTSYIGLRESLNYNPAKLLLDLAWSGSSDSTFKLPDNMTANMVEISINE